MELGFVPSGLGFTDAAGQRVDLYRRGATAATLPATPPGQAVPLGPPVDEDE